MIARFLSENLAVRNLDSQSKIKAVIKKEYPAFLPDTVKDRLDDFFSFSNYPGSIDKRYRKIFFITGEDWFVLGKIACHADRDSGYYQKVAVFNYEKDDNCETPYGGKWNTLPLGMLDGGYSECIGKEEDVPFMFRNLDILFRMLSRCDSAKSVYHILENAASGKTAWKPVK